MFQSFLRIGLMACGWAIVPLGGTAQTEPVHPSLLPLLKRSFVHGREYFVLRSGRAKLIAQADQVDLPFFISFSGGHIVFHLPEKL